MSETDRQLTEEVHQLNPPLPEESGLTLEEYLAMQQATGHPTRFRILRMPVVNEELSAADLKAAVDVESHNFYYHLDERIDIGLVDNSGNTLYWQPTSRLRPKLSM
jgi:hypothetical protein